ncbi:hypothetical protein DSECCO2_293300 [anaerobic digester metagenome]
MRRTFPKYLLPAFLLMACFINVKAQDRYFHLKGNIDNEESVTADFVIFGSKITGTVQNHFTAGEPEFFSGEVNAEGQVVLRVKDSEKTIISGSLNKEGTFFGNWLNPAGEARPFEMSPFYPEGTHVLTAVSVTSVQSLNDEPGSPVAAYEASYLSLPREKYEAISEKLAGLVYSGLFRSKPAIDPLALLRNQESDFFNQYRSSSDGIDIQKNYQHLNWEKSRLLSVAFNENNIISLYLKDYAYTGGTEGLEINRMLVFDAERGEKVDFSALFLNESASAITGLIRNVICAKTGIDPTADLTGYGFFSNEIPVPQHFALTEYGILCHYNIYEIAGPETGAVSVFLPYRQLQPLLNPLHPVVARLK